MLVECCQILDPRRWNETSALAEYNGGIYNEEGINVDHAKKSLTRMVRLKIILKLHLLKILAY